MKLKKKVFLLIMMTLTMLSTVTVYAGEAVLPLNLGNDTKTQKLIKKASTGMANNKIELLEDIEMQMNEHKSEVLVKYYNNDLITVQDVASILRTLNDSYGVANRSGYSVTTPKKVENYYVIKVLPKYHTTKKQEEALNKIVDQIVQSVTKTEMTDIEKAKALYNYLIDNVKYSMKTKGNMYTAHTALTEKAGVCNAYALAYSRLLDRVNIPNVYVKGDATTPTGEVLFHAWNKVKIDGKWYNTDVTWEDSSQLNKPRSTYRYFLKSDEVFHKDHKPRSLEKLPKSIDNIYDKYKIKQNEDNIK